MSKPTVYSPEALERILAALESEIIAATDDEIAEVLKELGMKPGMKGSAATADIRYRWIKARYGIDAFGARSQKDRARSSDGDGAEADAADPREGNANIKPLPGAG
jgi:hypothetical protein